MQARRKLSLQFSARPAPGRVQAGWPRPSSISRQKRHEADYNSRCEPSSRSPMPATSSGSSRGSLRSLGRHAGSNASCAGRSSSCYSSANRKPAECPPIHFLRPLSSHEYHHEPSRQACRGTRRAAVSGDGGVVSRVPAPRGRVRGGAGRPGSGQDVPEQARLPGGGGRGREGREAPTSSTRS